jgi:catechol 2,3-dioxygenase-like lactoylglutathione lyase family enzyme
MRWRCNSLVLILIIAFTGATKAQVQSVLRVGMTVDDLDRSLDFYTHVLEFSKVSETEIAGEQYEHLYGVFGMRARVATLKLGDEVLELTEYLTPKGRDIPRPSRSNDRWFQHIAIVTSDIDAAYRRLRENHVRHASTGPQRLPDWNKSAGGIKAFYFLDPDNHVLEIIQFPAGKGDSRWQDTSRLLLGIDHTAIVVQDTDQSLKFYRDLLGLREVGRSENYGTEQEHLNNVFGARLRITTLHAAHGPGVELLEYLAPRDGRPFPADAQSNDLFHWQTTFVCANPGVLNKPVIDLPETSLGFNQAALAHDPDGHIVQLVHQP